MKLATFAITIVLTAMENRTCGPSYTENSSAVIQTQYQISSNQGGIQYAQGISCMYATPDTKFFKYQLTKELISGEVKKYTTTCENKLQIEEKCTNDNQCATGICYNYGGSKTNKCSSQKTLDAECVENYHCDTMFCENLLCHTPIEHGEVCPQNEGEKCSAFGYCYTLPSNILERRCYYDFFLEAGDICPGGESPHSDACDTAEVYQANNEKYYRCADINDLNRIDTHHGDYIKSWSSDDCRSIFMNGKKDHTLVTHVEEISVPNNSTGFDEQKYCPLDGDENIFIDILSKYRAAVGLKDYFNATFYHRIYNETDGHSVGLLAYVDPVPCSAEYEIKHTYHLNLKASANSLVIGWLLVLFSIYL